MATKPTVNQMKSVGRELLTKKDLLNKAKTNAQLLGVLNSLDRNNLSTEAVDYLNNLTTEIQGTTERAFVKNYTHVYDVLLAGENLKVIR